MTTKAPITSAGAFRQVDALTGRIAELERQHQIDQYNLEQAEEQRDRWCDRCGELIAETERLKAERTELYRVIDGLRAERDHASGRAHTSEATS